MTSLSLSAHRLSTRPSLARQLSARKTPLMIAAGAVSTLLLGASSASAAWSVYDKSIPELESAYSGGVTTAVDVVQQYLDRISIYNKAGSGDGTLGGGGRGLNAMAQVNPSALADAAAVDALIAGGATTAQYPLLGVPILVKDSYDVKGLITTNGVSVLNGASSAGATTLVAPQDCFSVAQLKAAGAIIIGKATMSTMAYSFDGIDNAHGFVQNPYNPLRQPGGSSSGVGVGVAAQFAMLGMGGETGGSIRIPSNANACVGLKTSAGLIDPGGTWPLTPSRDVVGPIGRSVTDIAYTMNALVKPSNNLFSGTAYYPTGGPQPGAIGTGLGEGSDGTNKGLTSVTGTRPIDYTSFLSTNALQGKTLAVPNTMYIGSSAYEGTINPLVKSQFDKAIADLKAQGANVIFVNIPASITYYSTIGRVNAGGGPTLNNFPYAYPTTTSASGSTIPGTAWSSYAAAYYYEKEIESYGDPIIKNLNDFAAALAAGSNARTGSTFSTLNSAASNIAALAKIYNDGLAAGFDPATNPDALKALQAFTSLRQDQLEQYMTDNGIDAFVAPTYGTVMPYITASLRPPGTPADPYAVTGAASLLGRFEGNILGLPALSVPMGYFPDNTPMGMQFLGRFDGEAPLIGYAYDYEQATLWRKNPDLAFVPEPGAAFALILGGCSYLQRRRR